MCYTYDSLSRVTVRKTINLSTKAETTDSFSYDAASNLTFSNAKYDTNNRITTYGGKTVSYDDDGNMLSATLSGSSVSFAYDSANRLITAGTHSYTYDVDNIRVKSKVGSTETTYTHNANSRLSQLLVRTVGGVITKYVYGLGLIGEESGGKFKTYHFDYRGSTVAITDESGTVTDTFEYETYGRMTSRTGTTDTPFLYNGRDGVMTDANGLYYMRARYYSPELKRFVNADIVAGDISNAITLNRYAYANGNPVSNIDPFGLSADDGRGSTNKKPLDWSKATLSEMRQDTWEYLKEQIKKRTSPELERIKKWLSNATNSVGDWFNDNILDWIHNNVGLAVAGESKYNVISWDNLFSHYEYGLSLSKEYSGDYKFIEIIGQYSDDDSILSGQWGVKVNFDDSTGMKLSYDGLGTSFEFANSNHYYEVLMGLDKIGFTYSNSVDWKNYSVGEYHHYYFRPGVEAGKIVVAAGIAYLIVTAPEVAIPFFIALGEAAAGAV